MSLWLALKDPHYEARYAEKPVRRGMESWPRTAVDLGDIPRSFLRRMVDLLRREPDAIPVTDEHGGVGAEQIRRLPRAVFVPRGCWGAPKASQTSQTLLYCDDRGLHLIREAEGGHNRLIHRLLPYSRMQRIERGQVLLHSWLVIEDQTEAETVEFNSAAESVLLPVIRHVRLEAFGVEIADKRHRSGLDLRRLDPRIDLKFANYARQSLGTGEQVVTFSYLPGSPSHLRKLIILTDREVIEIREEDFPYTKFGSHGGVWSYIAV